MKLYIINKSETSGFDLDVTPSSRLFWVHLRAAFVVEIVSLMEAPRYFASYGAYVPVAASVATQQAPLNLAGGLPAPWTTLTQSSANPFSNFNAAVQSSSPVPIPPKTDNWFEMTSLQMSPPSSPQQKSAVETRPIQQKVIQTTQEALRRCSNCGGYYKNVDETCRYHPGHYRSVCSIPITINSTFLSILRGRIMFLRNRNFVWFDELVPEQVDSRFKQS